MGQRMVLVTAHTGRENALRSAQFVADRLTAAGIAVRTLAGEFSSPGAEQVRPAPTRRRAPSWSSSWAATAACCAPLNSPAPPGCR